MPAFLSQPWPWYVAGPLIGAMVPLLLLAGGRQFGVSSSLRTMCAVVAPPGVSFFRFDWRRAGAWQLAFVAGILAGGFIAGVLFGPPEPVAISAQTTSDLMALGIRDFDGLVPADLFSWSSLLTPRGLLILVLGGLLVGFGAAYAGGCTSGHAITGLADLQLPSLLAVTGFFAGGLITTHFLLPVIL